MKNLKLENLKFNYCLLILGAFLTSLLLSQCTVASKSPEGGQVKKTTVLNGRVLHQNEPHLNFTYDIYTYIQGSRRKRVQIDENGYFKISLDLSSPVEGVLNFGREMYKGRGINKNVFVYLEPGDSVFLNVDLDVLSDIDIIKNTLAFSGSHPANSRFLNDLDYTFNSYDQLRQNNYSFIVDKSPEEYVAAIDSIRDVKLKYLKNYADTSQLSPKLIDIYESKFKNTAITRKILYPSSRKHYAHLEKDVVLPDGYYSFMKDFTAKTDLDHVGTSYMIFLHFYLKNKYKLAKEKGYSEDYLSFIDTQLKGRQKYIYWAYSLNSDFNAPVYALFEGDSPYPDIKAAVKEKYGHLEGMLPGKPAPDVVFENIKDEVTGFSDRFSGSVVYIDFWATWCKPCVAQIPYLDTLKGEYKGKNIKFISISFDENKDIWKKFVMDKGLTGLQFWVDKKNKGIYDKHFNIRMIPRFVLIDNRGRIVDANAPRPSSGKEIRKLIDQALKKAG